MACPNTGTQSFTETSMWSLRLSFPITSKQMLLRLVITTSSCWPWSTPLFHGCESLWIVLTVCIVSRGVLYASTSLCLFGVVFVLLSHGEMLWVVIVHMCIHTYVRTYAASTCGVVDTSGASRVLCDNMGCLVVTVLCLSCYNYVCLDQDRYISLYVSWIV